MIDPETIKAILLALGGAAVGVGGSVFVQFLKGRSEFAQKMLGVDHEGKQAELQRTLQLLDTVTERWKTVEDIHAECPKRYQEQLEKALEAERLHCDRELRRAEAEWRFEHQKLKARFDAVEHYLGDISESEEDTLP